MKKIAPVDAKACSEQAVYKTGSEVYNWTRCRLVVLHHSVEQ